MRIAESEIERVKSTRSVLELMENPKRSGKCYKARCPLPGHEEKTPSFYYYPDGGYWCFGCGRGGKDVISFAFQYWELSWPKGFPAALEKLGARTDVSAGTSAFLPPTLKSTAPPRDVWPTLPDAAGLAVYKVAAEVWQYNLWQPTGKDALDYVRRRGIPDTIIRREWMGFSTDVLADALERHGLSLQVAQGLGLLRPNGHEVFTGRVVAWDWRRVNGTWTPVWATARTCTCGADWDDAPKYLNVRGDRLLGGLDSALGCPAVAVVEGAFDRLAVLSFGDSAVFMGSNDPSGAILAEIRRLSRRSVLYLIRDGDRAGRRGSWSTIYKLDLPPAARLVLVDLPQGIKDPGALAQRPDGAALYWEAKRRGRVIDMEAVKRRCDRCHEIVERHRAISRGASRTRHPGGSH